MTIDERVIIILSELSRKEAVKQSDSLQDDLALDSLSMVILLLEIEAVFNIEICESDMNLYNLFTVQDVIDIVRKYYDVKSEYACQID